MFVDRGVLIQAKTNRPIFSLCSRFVWLADYLKLEKIAISNPSNNGLTLTDNFYIGDFFY